MTYCGDKYLSTAVHKRRTPMTLKNISLNLEVGQTILVGQNDSPAKITKIEFHEKSGQVSLNTTRGPRSALTFKLCEQADNTHYETAADKYR